MSECPNVQESNSSKSPGVEETRSLVSKYQGEELSSLGA